MESVAKVASRLRFLVMAGMILTAVLAVAAPVPARTGKLSAELASLRKGTSVNVIVQYRSLSTSALAQARSISRTGMAPQRLSLINSFALNLKSDSLAVLANDPNVLHVSVDHQVFETSTTTDFYDQAVNAPYAWSAGLDGSGIGVAVIDS